MVTATRPWSDASVQTVALALVHAGPAGPEFLRNLLYGIIESGEQIGLSPFAAREIACNFGEEVLDTVSAIWIEPSCTIH